MYDNIILIISLLYCYFFANIYIYMMTSKLIANHIKTINNELGKAEREQKKKLK